jgi:hypothetical protein
MLNAKLTQILGIAHFELGIGHPIGQNDGVADQRFAGPAGSMRKRAPAFSAVST